MSSQIYELITYPYSVRSWMQYLSVIVKFILIFNILVISAYNIDTNYPILYPENASNLNQYLQTKFEHSYFGYSVLLHRNLQRNITWLFIGAPRGNYTRPSNNQLIRLNEPGVVYRCTLSGPCVEIETFISKNKKVHLSHIDTYATIENENSWFGNAMSIEKNNELITICASRTVANIHLFFHRDISTMHGLCYSGGVQSTTLNADIFDIENYSFDAKYWYNQLHGFSVNFALLQDKNIISRAIGEPIHESSGTININIKRPSTFVAQQSHKISMNSTIEDNDSFYLGYSLTSGYYFNQNQSLYASGAPQWEYVGQVVVFNANKDPFVVTKLHGNEIGEFFGASLASGDLNKDGLHDLLVGAPHWQNDNGKVYIYLGSQKGKFEAVTVLEGASEDGQFGYAIACGDLDNDGFSDMIVGAPWEESGVIYVYNGDASLKDKITPLMSQKITVQSSNNLPMNIHTFGFSISEPVDVDNNGYVDIAIGAYKSGHVVVLRSKPVVEIFLTVRTIPDTLEMNSTNFSVQVCVEYRGYDIANKHGFKISLTIDTKYMRTKETVLELFSMDSHADMCVNTSVMLLANIQEFIEPIMIYASHDFIYKNNSSPHEFCKICPIESKNNRSHGTHISLPFDIGCGDDRICNSNISATVRLKGTRDNDTWIIGSNDITLEISLINYAEPAYLTTVVFTLPDGIVLRSILPFCEEDTDKDILIVTCNVGNLFGTNKQKIIKLDLDMKHLIDGSLHGKILEFSTKIRTRNVNHGIDTIISPLILQSEASLLLNGIATEENYYLYDSDKENMNISFQHTYQILKLGATPIQEARLIIKIPTTKDDLSSLVFLYKPQLYVSGEHYECSSNGIDLIEMQESEFHESTISSVFNWNASTTINETLNNTTHLLRKRNIVNSPTAVNAHTVQTFQNAKTAMSENHNLTMGSSNSVYLNCSTRNVNCSIVYCDLSALKTSQDVGKLVMRLILDTAKFKDYDRSLDDRKSIRFSTEAHVQIIQPVNTISDKNTRHNITLTTEIHTILGTRKLQLWIVIASVFFGLILLCICIIILNKVNFFKRTIREELAALKTNEVIEDTNTIDITSEESE